MSKKVSLTMFWVFAILSVFFFAGILENFEENTLNQKVGNMAILMLFIAICIVALISRKNAIKQENDLKTEELERSILLLARKKNACLSVSDTSLDLNISRELAKSILESMVIKGIAITEVKDNGVIEYFFPELE